VDIEITTFHLWLSFQKKIKNRNKKKNKHIKNYRYKRLEYLSLLNINKNEKNIILYMVLK